MISKQAVEGFLSRELLNHDWLKDAREKELNEALTDFPKLPSSLKRWAGRTGYQIYIHQKVCLLLMLTLQRFMLFLDMGGGKTFLTLTVINYLKRMGERPRAIIFVPYITAVETWVEETEIHYPNLTCIPLLGTGAENLELLKGEGDLFVATYQTATAMLADKKKSNKKGKKVEWNLNPDKVRRSFKGFTMLVMDEIHKIKNHTSLYYRMCRAISTRVDWAYGLTGTPFGKDLTDLWSQFHVIDFGETLGDTLGLFREVFFSQSNNYWGGYEYKFKKKMLKTLKRMIKNRSIRYSIDECHDMPAKAYLTKKVKPTEGIKGYYNAAVEKFEQERGKHKKQNYRQVESTWVQMRQLSSGFMTLKGEDSDKVEIEFDENPKLDTLVDLIDEMPPDAKMIVFHDYVHTNNIISKRLTKMKIGHARIWGKQKDPISELRRFKRDPKCRVLVLNSKSGSSSLNLQIANYIVFFEQPTSSTDREQGERRVWRPGQKLRVLIFDLIMIGTTDDKQRKSNNDSTNLMKEVLDGRERIGKL